MVRFQSTIDVCMTDYSASNWAELGYRSSVHRIFISEIGMEIGNRRGDYDKSDSTHVTSILWARFSSFYRTGSQQWSASRDLFNFGSPFCILGTGEVKNFIFGKTVPGSWTRIAETTFTKFSSCPWQYIVCQYQLTSACICCRLWRL